MRDKYANKSTAGKIFHKYTGIIVVGSLVAFAFVVFDYYTAEQEFFESWSCKQMYEYMLNGEGFGFVPHSDLTDEQHIKLHEIFFNDCQEYNHK